VDVFLLVVCLLLASCAALASGLAPSSAWLLARSQAEHIPPSAAPPRCPDDGPACRLASTPASGGGLASPPVRPWGEVTSRRGAPKRRPTSGFACPNPPGGYFGIPEAHLHARVGDGKHGRAEQIQPLRGPACHTPFSARRHTPLSRLKTPAHQIALVLAALAQGLDLAAAERVAGLSSGHHHEPFSRARARTPRTFHERSFCSIHLPPLHLDELRPRLHRTTQILWLWLATDPLTKIIPVLELGPPTPHLAPLLIPSLRQMLAAFLPSALDE
jgi:hypothetical protein